MTTRMENSGTGSIVGKGVCSVRLTHKPLMTLEEWRDAGRPVTLVRWTMDVPAESVADHVPYLYAQTHAPLCDPLDVVAVVPMNALKVEVGWFSPAGEVFAPAVWWGYESLKDASRARQHKNPGPVVVGWDRHLTHENAQQYLVSDDPRRVGPDPYFPSPREAAGEVITKRRKVKRQDRHSA